jgi:hypothetical protein
MSSRPSHRRPCPPAIPVPPQRRNGHAQVLSPRAWADSRRPQRWHARPPTVGYRPTTRRTPPHAGRGHLEESKQLLLLLL